MATAYLGIGTNLGDRADNVARALREISRVSRIFAVSRIYETAPIGFLEQPAFWNLVVRVSTSLVPSELLYRLKAIEVAMGRMVTFANGPRVIDIDILFYDNLVCDVGPLVIPHPRALQRAFVLRPFLEIAPFFIDPRSGERVSSFLPSVSEQRVSLVTS